MDLLLRLKPDSARAYQVLSTIAMERNDLPLAKEYTERALSRNPGNPLFWYQRGFIAEREGQAAPTELPDRGY